MLWVPVSGWSWAARFGGGEEENHFAADGVAGRELRAHIGDGAAQELFVDLGEFAGEDDGTGGAEDGLDVG